MTDRENNGSPCLCGAKDTWHQECYHRKQATKQFQELRNLLPPDVSWGQSLTPDIVDGIRQAAIARWRNHPSRMISYAGNGKRK